MLPSGWPWTGGAHWGAFWCRVRFAPIVALMGCAVVSAVAPPAAVPLGREPQMRVLVQEGPRLALRADGEQLFQVRGLPGGTRTLRRLVLSLRGGALLAELDGEQQRLPASSLLQVRSSDPRGIWLAQRRYRGELRLSGRGGQLRAVNALGIESYLMSVVGSEMPHEWPLAALQAQAVAARTYALQQRSRGGGWDLKATVASQVYLGVESETPRTRQAVASTRSLVLVHGGKLINAVFHSSSGGVTEASGMVWRNQLPYLVSVPDHDQHSPMHRWQERFDLEGLRQRLPETGGVDAVDVLSRSASGRVRQARLRGPRGSLLLSGADLRRRLGLKSTLVNFQMVPAMAPPEPVPVLRATPVQGASRIAQITASVSRPSPALLGGLGRERRQALPGWQLLVTGQGHGHGVGMSQWGANGLARQGADFRTILRHYYRGAEVMPYQPHHDGSVAQTWPSAPAWRG